MSEHKPGYCERQQSQSQTTDCEDSEAIIIPDDPVIREMELRQYARGALAEQHGIKPGMLNWPMFMRELFAEIDRLRSSAKKERANAR